MGVLLGLAQGFDSVHALPALVNGRWGCLSPKARYFGWDGEMELPCNSTSSFAE
jgi:hypothetical protein